jgi:hypothetical protein
MGDQLFAAQALGLAAPVWVSPGLRPCAAEEAPAGPRLSGTVARIEMLGPLTPRRDGFATARCSGWRPPACRTMRWPSCGVSLAYDPARLVILPHESS